MEADVVVVVVGRGREGGGKRDMEVRVAEEEKGGGDKGKRGESRRSSVGWGFKVVEEKRGGEGGQWW